MIDNRPLVTVVVPVYNVENYVRQCLDSILNQTFKSIEVILSDDGSTDSSGSICDEYSMVDDRIRVIHARNAGLSEARNRGIEQAKGEYICFIDSDDYIKETFVEYLLTLAEKFHADMSICPCIKDCNGELRHAQSKGVEKGLDPRSAYELIFIKREFVGVYACNKLYKTKLFNGIRYPVGRYYEDSGTTYKLIGRSTIIAYGDIPQYYYRIGREGAITSDSLKKVQKRYLDKLCFLNEVEAYLIKNPTLFSSAFYNMYFGDILSYYSIIDEKNEPKLLKDMEQALDEHIISVRDKSGLTRNVRIKLAVYRMSKKLYKKVFR